MKITKQELIAGLDEVGMGSLAGPLVVCVAAFQKGMVRLAGVFDSKSVSAKNRKSLVASIIKSASFISFGFANAARIDRDGLSTSWQFAANMALSNAPDFQELIIDGVRSVDSYIGKQIVKPKADVLHWQVSAASIVAKVLRDEHMTMLAKHYKGFNWEENSGYGAKKHQEFLLSHGPTPQHRMSFLAKMITREKPIWALQAQSK